MAVAVAQKGDMLGQIVVVFAGIGWGSGHGWGPGGLGGGIQGCGSAQDYSHYRTGRRQDWEKMDTEGGTLEDSSEGCD
ncbi:hypothetical protein MishRS11D_04350 [Methylomagnum ishizawai]|nr:hypothetical protein MishRS11D_04350 [Methylomagnum ishizawai]